MRQILFFTLFVVAGVFWCSPSFAVQTVNPSGTVDATGQAEGVSMAGGAGTLTVSAGFNNLFTNNSLGGAVINSALAAVRPSARW